MIERGNPLGIAATGQIDVDLEGQMKKLHERIVSAEQDRHNWVAKQQILTEQRRGIRPARPIPWPGCNNDNIPLTDGVIRRWKPQIVSLVMDADPVAWFFATKPEDVESARDAQHFYHWKFHQIPGLLRTINVLADNIGERGIAWTRQGWKYETDRVCRIVRSAALFPGGPQAATAQFNQAQQAQYQQMVMAAQQGQIDPAQIGEPPQVVTEQEFCTQVLVQEYNLDPNNPEVSAAVAKILQGAEYIKIYYEKVICDRPDFRVLSALDVVEPTMTTAGGAIYDFLAIVHRMTEDQIRRMVRDGYFKADAAEEVIKRMASKGMGAEAQNDMISFDGRSSTGRAQIASALDEIEGVSQVHGMDYPHEPIWEVYGKLDVDGDGILERVIIWYHPATATILSIFHYPYPFSEWPLTKFEFEVSSERPYQARGIAEMLSTFQKLTNKLHNARLDAIQILLSPMFKVRSVNGEIGRQIKYRPGTIIPLPNVDDLQPVIQDFRPLGQFLQEENYTKTLAEQYVGVFDQSIAQLGRAERRTATEVEAITAQISQIFSGDAGLFQEAMSQVHRQLWQLWLDFGPEEEYYRVTGNDQPQRIRKADISRNYDIYPAGTPANTNKALAMARAREMLQIFMADPTGLINKRVLYKAYTDLTDRNLSKMLVRSEEEAAAVQMVMQSAAAIAEEQGGEPPGAF